jgi:hypothetical protein
MRKTSVTTAAGSDAGGVVLRGVAVALDTDVGRMFVVDCARNTEGLLPDAEIKSKYELSDRAWERLADNTPMLHAVRAERARRITSGDAAREAAQRFFAKAPDVLGGILTSVLVSPRHRIDAAKELREVAANGPEKQVAGEKFVIVIDLGGGDVKRYEAGAPRGTSVLSPPDEEDAPPQ